MNNKSEFLRVSQQASSSLGVAYGNRRLALLSAEVRLKQLRIQTNFLSEDLFFDLCAELKLDFFSNEEHMTQPFRQNL